jgi:hypothetical protein
MQFRDLKPEEIDIRVAMINEKGISLLLYKDARVDMDILDETLGSENWQRDHKELKGNIYCGVSIWDDKKEQWITKWDAGAESYTEKEKGEASDSFKRACVNIGIGRELYTAPFIWIPAEKCKIVSKNGKYTTTDKFHVSAIKIENKQIIGLQIKNQSNQEVYLLKPPTSKS